MRKKYLAGRPGWKVAVTTPRGEFPSASEAARAHGVTNGCVMHRLRSPTFPDWTSPAVAKLEVAEPDDGTKVRVCLKCRCKFDSTGPGNRLCRGCKPGDGLPDGWFW